ncbi:MAG: 2-oxoglutarate and iron-dependent oxygenase domain-containing protein [Actinomycetota bacterium]
MTATGFDTIPVLGLGPLDGSPDERAGAADQLTRILHEVGFVLVVDHGVESAVVDDVFDLMHRFFSLAPEEKALIDKRRSRHFRGWEPVGTEFTNNRPDLREQIDLWSEWPAHPIDVEPTWLRLLGPNQWMPEDVLPGHRAICQRWFCELGGLARRLLGALSLGLRLDVDELDRRFGAQPMSLTKLIHYPPTPAGGAGVNAHHDAGFLTVLAPGPTPGLQVENPDGDWIDVPAVPGSFVINVGEVLQSMTGNYLVATPHRVISPDERYSAGYFHGASLDTDLSPLTLDPGFTAAVAASPRHSSAGFMARKHETEAGVGDMASQHRPATYGEQLWNYFERSYPDQVAAHYGAAGSG